MDERIQALSDRAKASVPAGLPVDQWIQVYNQNLAELIILECEVIINHTKSPWPYASEFFIKAIKEHFGVKK